MQNPFQPQLPLCSILGNISTLHFEISGSRLSHTPPVPLFPLMEALPFSPGDPGSPSSKPLSHPPLSQDIVLMVKHEWQCLCHNESDENNEKEMKEKQRRVRSGSSIRVTSHPTCRMPSSQRTSSWAQHAKVAEKGEEVGF